MVGWWIIVLGSEPVEHWATFSSPFIFKMWYRVSISCPSWAWACYLPASASSVAGITGMHYPIWLKNFKILMKSIRFMIQVFDVIWKKSLHSPYLQGLYYTFFLKFCFSFTIRSLIHFDFLRKGLKSSFCIWIFNYSKSQYLLKDYPFLSMN